MTTGFRITFHFRHNCEISIGYFRTFSSISLTVTGRFSRTRQNNWRWQSSESITFQERSSRHPDSDQSENLDSN